MDLRPRSAGYDTTAFSGIVPGNTFAYRPSQTPTGPSRSSTMHDLRRMSHAPPPSALTSSYSTGTINSGKLPTQRSLPESVLKRDLVSFQQYQYQQQQHNQGDPSPPTVRPKIPPPGFQYGKVFGPGDATQPDNSWEEMNSRYLFIFLCFVDICSVYMCMSLEFY
jgi:hypothetical protein